MDRSNEYVTSMVVVENGTFFGQTNRYLNYCELESLRACKTIEPQNSKITGIAYDSKREKIYVSLARNGALYICPSDPKKTDSCKLVYEHNKHYRTAELTAVHVAYEAECGLEHKMKILLKFSNVLCLKSKVNSNVRNFIL